MGRQDRPGGGGTGFRYGCPTRVNLATYRNSQAHSSKGTRIAARPHPEQGYRAALGIIRLARRYGADRLEAACARALHLRSYSYRSVESILRHSLDRQPLPGAQAPAAPHPAHGNVRGPGYYT